MFLRPTCISIKNSRFELSIFYGRGQYKLVKHGGGRGSISNMGGSISNKGGGRGALELHCTSIVVLQPHVCLSDMLMQAATKPFKNL